MRCWVAEEPPVSVSASFEVRDWGCDEVEVDVSGEDSESWSAVVLKRVVSAWWMRSSSAVSRVWSWCSRVLWRVLSDWGVVSWGLMGGEVA